LLSSQFFRHPDRGSLSHNHIHEQPLFLVRLEGKQDFGVPNGNPPLLEERLRSRVQVEQSHRVCKRRSTLADALGDLILGEAEIAMEPLVRAGLLDWIEILALEVFDKRELKDLAIACRPDNRRGFGELELARGTPAAFTGDKFVGVAHLPNDERLNDAAFPDALHQFLEMLASKLLSWLERAGCNLI
jgi:hypothetical protein